MMEEQIQSVESPSPASFRKGDTSIRIIISQLDRVGKHQKSFQIRPCDFQPDEIMDKVGNFLGMGAPRWALSRMSQESFSNRHKKSNKNTNLLSNYSQSRSHSYDRQAQSKPYQKQNTDNKILNDAFQSLVERLQFKLSATNQLLDKQRDYCKQLFTKNQVTSRQNDYLRKEYDRLFDILRKVNNEGDASLTCQHLSESKHKVVKALITSREKKIGSPNSNILSDMCMRSSPSLEQFGQPYETQFHRKQNPHKSFAYKNFKRESQSQIHYLAGSQIKFNRDEFGLEYSPKDDLEDQNIRKEDKKQPFSFKHQPESSTPQNKFPRPFQLRDSPSTAILTHPSRNNIGINTLQKLSPQSKLPKSIKNQFQITISSKSLKKNEFQFVVLEFPQMQCDFEKPRTVKTVTERILLKQIDLFSIIMTKWQKMRLQVKSQRCLLQRQYLARIVQQLKKNLQKHTSTSLHELHNMCKKLVEKELA